MRFKVNYPKMHTKISLNISHQFCYEPPNRQNKRKNTIIFNFAKSQICMLAIPWEWILPKRSL